MIINGVLWYLLIAVAVPTVASLPLVSRHFGPMGHLKAELQRLEQETRTGIDSAAGDEGLAAVAEFERRHPTGVQFQLSPEYAPMAITITGRVPAPQLKVHFGHGGDAIFDSSTMACVYSD